MVKQSRKLFTSRYRTFIQLSADSWRNVLRLAGKDLIQYTPMIGKIFSLDQWQEAFEVVKEKKGIKAVLEF